MKGTAKFNANVKSLASEYTKMAAKAAQLAATLSNAVARAKAYAEAEKYEKRAAATLALALA